MKGYYKNNPLITKKILVKFSVITSFLLLPCVGLAGETIIWNDSSPTSLLRTLLGVDYSLAPSDGQNSDNTIIIETSTNDSNPVKNIFGAYSPTDDLLRNKVKFIKGSAKNIFGALTEKDNGKANQNLVEVNDLSDDYLNIFGGYVVNNNGIANENSLNLTKVFARSVVGEQL